MKPFETSATFDGAMNDFGRLHAWLDSLPREDAGIDDRMLSRIRLALAEAFSNAVRHGHSGAAGQPVSIRISTTPGPAAQVRLDVTDSGPGFQLAPPVTPDENAESGRGLIILRSLADRIEYNGNTLSLWLRPS